MARTKSHSSRIARIRDLANNITGELDALQLETDELYQDQARLREIEPALTKLQNALKPLAASTPPVETITGETPVTEQTMSGQPEKSKRKHTKKEIQADVTATGTE